MRGPFRIKRRLETKRAPQRRDNFGGNYTPSGIDIHTTADPALVSLNNDSDQRVRVVDLLSILDELDRFEDRKCLSGEKLEIHLDMVPLENDKGDVYHRPGFMIAKPSAKEKGFIKLDVFSRYGLGAITLTADRSSLREALENLPTLEALEQEDAERHPEAGK